MGVAIYANAGVVTRVAGRVQMLSPAAMLDLRQLARLESSPY